MPKPEERIPPTRSLIFVPCTCLATEHFLRISPDLDDPETVVVEFLSTRDRSFWRRLKWALKHVFQRQDLVFADVIVRRDELRAALDAQE